MYETSKWECRWYDPIEAYAAQDLFREMFPGRKPKVDIQLPKKV